MALIWPAVVCRRNTALGKSERMCATQTAPCAGHDRHFAFEADSHQSTSLLSILPSIISIFQAGHKVKEGVVRSLVLHPPATDASSNRDAAVS
jgi:hypothetical protein